MKTFPTSGTQPAIPAYGTVAKWYRAQRLSWNTTEWKCYIYNGQPFRVHFPKSYNPTANDGKVYPVFLFLHGVGEAGTAYDNEYQLYHGGQIFQNQIDNGSFDGYCIVPQSQGGWGPANYTNIIPVLNYMIANNKVDFTRIIVNGLSGGGAGCWEIADDYPQYFAGVMPMSAMCSCYSTSAWVNNMKYTAYWDFQGGQDGSPDPYTASLVNPYFYNAGANYTYTEFITQGHDTWDSAWQVPSFFPFVNAQHSNNPWPLFNHTGFCPGAPISVTMGVAPGYQAYRWRLNGGTPNPAWTTNQITVTAVGTYDCQVELNGVWSPWSPTPVTVFVQGATQTPNITLVNKQSVTIPSTDLNDSVTMFLPAGDSLYSWYKVGNAGVVGSSNTLTVGGLGGPGDYYATVIPKFGCSAIPSPVFQVVNAGGPNAPLAATNPVANGLGFTKTQLTWASQPSQKNPPTAFEIYRATKSGGPYIYLGQTGPSVLQYVDSANVLAGKTYYYVIRAIDTTGAAPLSPEVFATTSSDKTAPTGPTGLMSTITTSSTIAIKWNSSTDNVSVDHYNVYVNGTLTNVTHDTSFVLNSLTSGAWYSIYVTAVDPSGNESVHSPQLVSEAINGGLIYNYYTSTTNLTSVQNLVSMTPVASGQEANVGIGIFPGTTTNFGYIWHGYITIPVSGTYNFATASDDASALWFNTLTPGTDAAATVNNDYIQGTTQRNSAALNLTAGTYPICIAFVQQGGGSAMSVLWSSQKLNGNTTYVAIPNQYFAGTVTSPGSVPKQPTTVRATATAYNQTQVTWTDNSNNETGFEVYRATSASGPFAIAGTAPAGSTSFTDAGLTGGTTYFYKVQAINNSGASGFDSLSMSGLTYKVYSGAFGSPMPNFNTLTPVATGNINNVNIAVAGSLTTNFGLLFTGVLRAPATGTYTFQTSSDDASALYIGGYPNGTKVVNNDAQQGTTTKTGTITLTKGQTYAFAVPYDQGTGSYVLTAAWKTPGSTTAVAIPDSVFAYAGWTCTTPAAPAAPATPVVTASATSSSKITLNWTETSPVVSGYVLNRSANDQSHFQLLANITGNPSSYLDSSLFGHTQYYYQLQAVNASGSSAFSAIAGTTTLDNFPVVTAVPSQTARYGVTTTINLQATDPDGDALTFTGLNLPAFASLQDNGNGTAVLTLNPTQAQSGSYNGIGATVSDGKGGSTNIAFNLTVNGNYAPVLTAVSPVQVNTNATVKIPLTATDQNGDNLTFTVSGVPGNNSLVLGPNGSDTLVVTPGLATTGTYTVTVTVNDGNGGITTTTFPLTVSFVTPTKVVYIRANDGDPVGAPWNNFTSQITSNLLDINGVNTGWTFNLNTGWWGGSALGPTTGNNSGVYPDNVMKDFWFFAYAGGPATVDPIISGLDTTQLYNITLFGSSVFNWVPDNGTTVYSAQGQTQSLYVQNNTKNTVTLTNLKPDATGSITFHMAVTPGTPVGYLNALVINQLFDDGTLPLSPHNLTTALSGSSVVLSWSDSAYNEQGYEVWRATNAAGPFTLLTNQIPPKTVSYTDSTAFGFTTYYYEVRAYNQHGYSYYTNVASATTPDKVPTLNPIGNLSLGWDTDTVINITTTNAAGNTVTLTGSNLPSWAVLTDNGNGTGTLAMNVPDSTSGSFSNLTITMTDRADSVRTTSFNLTVKNPLVTTTYIHFSDGINNGAAPWNNINIWPGSGFSQTNLLNDNGVNSGITLTYQSNFQGFNNSGDITGNNSGIFPDGVMGSCLFDAGSQTDSILLSGLTPGARYTFGVFSSSNWQVAGNTNFTLLGTTQSVFPAYNTNNLLQWRNVTPRANGTVSLGVQKASAAQYSFLNDIIVQQYDTSKLKILGPSYLQATQITRNSVSLHWTDNSWNETNEEVWRATDGQPYKKIATLSPNVVTYKDSALASNSTYYYSVRAVKGTLPSTYSNPVKATTTSYAVYMEFNEPGTNLAPLPWNPMNQAPTNGTVWKNLWDDQGNPTSTGAVINGLFDVTNLGTVTGNNSGVVPDAVMVDNYLVFSGGSAAIIINGLNINGLYDVTFFNSFFQSDVVTRFMVNGQPVILDASLNTSATITAYGIKPDAFGQITVTIQPNLQTTAYATLNAIILRGYSPDNNPVPATPVTTSQVVTQTQSVSHSTQDASVTPSVLAGGDTVIAAYPNPFKTSFTLQVPAVSEDKALVEMYSTDGQQVYANEFKNLVAGTNYLTIQPAFSLNTGVYIVKVRTKEGNMTKTIKVLKQ
ncbi:MAG TPA: PA14 domain-containing protein [Dinghuibacter sp.]|uniref:fibronectin type III domain-containing protein n=1 Tax=Dinghuibacter sp. TaxID=2024697 RepID=UPI002D09F689|nr:PA14 domain-containing protein [Dinghuibacter sp.]HTJ14484.1 PA14 domain-containing protein [Dinghuibacter sp.]